MAVALELFVNETVNCLADVNVKMVTVQNRFGFGSWRNTLLSYFGKMMEYFCEKNY